MISQQRMKSPTSSNSGCEDSDYIQDEPTLSDRLVRDVVRIFAVGLYGKQHRLRHDVGDIFCSRLLLVVIGSDGRRGGGRRGRGGGRSRRSGFALIV
jgi:hypothetical protein